MQPGIYVQGEYFAMGSRGDLGAVALQAALARNHGASGMVQCACRYLEGEQLPMEVVHLELRRQGGAEFRVDRRRVSDAHHPQCIFRRGTDEDPVEFTELSASIFSLPKRRTGDSLTSSGDHSGARWTGFTQYARQSWSRGYTAAFVDANRGAQLFREVRNPHATEILLGIERELHGRRFSCGRDGFDVARAQQLELVFGICDWDLSRWSSESRSNTGVPLHAWVAHNGRLQSRRFVVPSALLTSAADSVRILMHVRPPPFLFQAIVEPSGVLRLLVLKPVWFDGQHLVFSDSLGETGYYQHLAEQGLGFYRGLDSLGDYERMVPDRLKICRLPSGVSWPCNPDALVYAGPVCWVVECRGFTENRDGALATQYHERYDAKASQLTRLLQGTTARFVEEVSANFRGFRTKRPNYWKDQLVREYPPQAMIKLGRL